WNTDLRHANGRYKENQHTEDRTHLPPLLSSGATDRIVSVSPQRTSGLTRCRSRRSGVVGPALRASLRATLRVARLEGGAATRLSINSLGGRKMNARFR